MGLEDARREEGGFRIPCGEVAPETRDRDQVGALGLEWQPVVLVLRPFLGGTGRPVIPGGGRTSAEAASCLHLQAQRHSLGLRSLHLGQGGGFSVHGPAGRFVQRCIFGHPHHGFGVGRRWLVSTGQKSVSRHYLPLYSGFFEHPLAGCGGGLVLEPASGAATHASGIFQGPAAQGGFEPLGFKGIDGLQFPELLQMACRGSGLAVQSTGQEGFLNQIQPPVSPGFPIRFQIRPQQVVIDEGARPLVGQVRSDDRLEEARIFPLQEEIHLMAGELRIPGASLVGCQRRPTHQPIEACQLRIGMERPQQAEHRFQRVVGFPLAVPGLRQRQALSADQPPGIPDFRRAARCLQHTAQALILKGDGLFGSDNRQPRGLGGVFHVHLDE